MYSMYVCGVFMCARVRVCVYFVCIFHFCGGTPAQLPYSTVTCIVFTVELFQLSISHTYSNIAV